MRCRQSKSKHRRYYADECIPISSVTYLKSKGFSIIHALDVGAVNISDPEQLKKSKKLGRVLVSLDRKDFPQRMKYDLSGHPGVIVLKTRAATPLKINRTAEKVLKRIHRIKLKEAILHASTVKIKRYRKGKEDAIPWKK